jgi:hypothetical protein
VVFQVLISGSAAQSVHDYANDTASLQQLQLYILDSVKGGDVGGDGS